MKATIATTNARIDSLEAKLDQLINQVAELAEAQRKAAEAPVVTAPKKGRKSTKTEAEKAEAEAKSKAFIDHLTELHERTPEEKAAAKADWHAFYDAKWAEWKAEADAKGLKGAARREANKERHQKLMLEWKNR